MLRCYALTGLLHDSNGRKTLKDERRVTPTHLASDAFLVSVWMINPSNTLYFSANLSVFMPLRP